jgi:site-specific recombinase XerD
MTVVRHSSCQCQQQVAADAATTVFRLERDRQLRDVLFYVRDLSRSGLARATLAQHVSAIRSFLRYCQATEVSPAMPLDLLRRPRVLITSMNRYLTQDEAERLLDAARVAGAVQHLAVVLLVGTGLRVGELVQARWRDVFRDPRGNTGLLVVGKGGVQRTVGLRDDVLQVLVDERRRRRLATRLSATDDAPLVADRKGRAVSARTVRRWLRPITAAAGVEKPVSPHWLRHTFGTLTALNGAGVFSIQAAMGHAQIVTSQRYVHWSRGVEDSAAFRLPLRIARRAPPGVGGGA